MLNHDLILCAAEQAVRARGPVGATFIQRRVRVGFATASQLLGALESIGVLGPVGPAGRLWPRVDTFDREAVLAATTDAAAAGKFELDGEPCGVCRAESAGGPRA